MEHDRKLVFISHANPQDNDATLWLASKLACAGYEVWSDLTKLFGGELFWDDIEDAIRNHAAKVLVLVSRHSQISQGVLNEVNLAVTLEHKKSLPRFVIPLRLDGLPFDEFKVNIARKNAIDFSSNWAHGLNQLLERLDRDNVPRSTNNDPNNISAWFSEHHSVATPVLVKPQLLTSNWIPITKFPQNLYFSRIPVSGSKVHELVSGLPYPSFSYQQFVASFALRSELKSGMPPWLALTQGHTINTREFIDAKVSEFPMLNWRDSHNMISGLLRKAWDREMQTRGLLPYVLSDYTTAWFFPKDFIAKDAVQYLDMDGKSKTKNLVGRSERRQVHWHFAVSVHPVIGRLKRFSLRTHVVFTTDGVTPLESKDRMHTLRRSFCRSWWNERWRGLLLAYLTHLSNGKGGILLSVAPHNSIDLNSVPFSFCSPVSLEESTIPYEEVPDDVFYGSPYDDNFANYDELEMLENIEDANWGENTGLIVDNEENETNTP